MLQLAPLRSRNTESRSDIFQSCPNFLQLYVIVGLDVISSYGLVVAFKEAWKTHPATRQLLRTIILGMKKYNGIRGINKREERQDCF
jgi:hypothetical protein